MITPNAKAVTGVILAGGRGQRMRGQDKGLITYKGSPLIEHVISMLSPQVDELLINANRNIEIYQQYGYPVFADELPEYPGPLAGMLTALGQASHDYVIFVACDTPDLPNDLVQRLSDSADETRGQACFAHDGQRAHPVTALLRATAQIPLAQYLAQGNNKVMDWMQTIGATPVDFSDVRDAFANINSLEDLRR